jgi:hypothetical protein
MSLFDVIKYSDIDINDIESNQSLNQLPKKVVENWHARLVEHACKSAESISHQDKSGKCRELIDAIRAFMRNEISKEAYYVVYYAAKKAGSTDSAGRSAESAAGSLSSTALNTAHNTAQSVWVARNAANAAYYAANAANAAGNAAMKLYKDWLMEELLAHDLK